MIIAILYPTVYHGPCRPKKSADRITLQVTVQNLQENITYFFKVGIDVAFSALPILSDLVGGRRDRIRVRSAGRGQQGFTLAKRAHPGGNAVGRWRQRSDVLLVPFVDPAKADVMHLVGNGVFKVGSRDGRIDVEKNHGVGVQSEHKAVVERFDTRAS